MSPFVLSTGEDVHNFEVFVVGHSPANEEVFQAIEDFLSQDVFGGVVPFGLLEDYDIDYERGFDRHSTGVVPECVGVWTKKSDTLGPTRIVARRIDWKHSQVDGEPTTIMTVQLEQH